MEAVIQVGNKSVIVKLIYATQAFLFSGDAQTEKEDLLVKDPATNARFTFEPIADGQNIDTKLKWPECLLVG